MLTIFRLPTALIVIVSKKYLFIYQQHGCRGETIRRSNVNDSHNDKRSSHDESANVSCTS